jgi:hypothetical protein
VANESFDQAYAAPPEQAWEALRQTIAQLGYKDISGNPAPRKVHDGVAQRLGVPVASP